MERLFKFIFSGLFIIGFVGAVASAGHDSQDTVDVAKMNSLIEDTQFAQEVNDLNSGKAATPEQVTRIDVSSADKQGSAWTQDISQTNKESLAKVEEILKIK